MTIKRLLTIKEAAKFLGLSVWTLRHHVCQGRISSVKVGGRRMFDIKDLEDIIVRLALTIPCN
jgi:excisionase family DNA binding protein